MFLIPYNKLSDEQRTVIRRVSRQSSNLFVDGPPGSGKTLISLYILKDLIEQQNIRPLLVIYNHSLYGYLRSALKELNLTDNVTIATKDKLFWDLARQSNISASGNNYDEKYESSLAQIQISTLHQRFDFAVVDEVQDFSEKEWDILNAISRRVTSLGDFDQGVYSSNLKKERVISKSIYEKLTDIFRFHKNIATIAEKFSKKAAKLEQMVTRIEKKEVQLLDVPFNKENSTIAEILQTVSKQTGKVGILAPSKHRLTNLSIYLESRHIKHNFYNDNKALRDYDFDDNTPLLLTPFSAKGLEFEHVILFGYDDNDNCIENLKIKNKLNDVLYVSITRTNSALYIIRTPSTVIELRELVNQSPETSVNIDDIF